MRDLTGPEKFVVFQKLVFRSIPNSVNIQTLWTEMYKPLISVTPVNHEGFQKDVVKWTGCLLLFTNLRM